MSYQHEKNTYLKENQLNDQFNTFDIVLTYKLPPVEELKLYDIVLYEVQGGNLKHLFVTEPCRDLDFLIQYVSATEFHVYMYENDDLNLGTVNQTQIKVFMTILVETNGVWSAQESQLGYATIRYFDNTSNLAILPEEWVYGVLPQ